MYRVNYIESNGTISGSQESSARHVAQDWYDFYVNMAKESKDGRVTFSELHPVTGQRKKLIKHWPKD